MVFAIKADIADLSAQTFRFVRRKTMYGGKRIAAGDVLYIFASENEGGPGLIARGVVTKAAAVPKTPGVVRQTPLVTIRVARTGTARRPLGRGELRSCSDWRDGRPETELNFKFYRQATNKIVGLSDVAAAYLEGFFARARREPTADAAVRVLLCMAAVSLAAFGCVAPDPAPALPGTWVEAGTGMVFVRLEPGTFTMGTPENEAGREPQEQQHLVRLPDPFWLGIFEVTQHEWQAVMGTSPSHFPDASGRRPVENVTWVEVHAFLDRLTARAPGNRFRLPTEAEWEYACRAGTTNAYGTGPTFGPAQGNIATSIARSMAGDGQTMAVGAFPPNAWGLHDMQGNVWEWTEDPHCPYPDGPIVDPAPACDSPLKVIRGGSWYFEADSARCGLRYTHHPDDRGFSLGFRVVREPVDPDANAR